MKVPAPQPHLGISQAQAPALRLNRVVEGFGLMRNETQLVVHLRQRHQAKSEECMHMSNSLDDGSGCEWSRQRKRPSRLSEQSHLHSRTLFRPELKTLFLYSLSTRATLFSFSGCCIATTSRADALNSKHVVLCAERCSLEGLEGMSEATSTFSTNFVRGFVTAEPTLF